MPARMEHSPGGAATLTGPCLVGGGVIEKQAPSSRQVSGLWVDHPARRQADVANTVPDPCAASTRIPTG